MVHLLFLILILDGIGVDSRSTTLLFFSSFVCHHVVALLHVYKAAIRLEGQAAAVDSGREVHAFLLVLEANLVQSLQDHVLAGRLDLNLGDTVFDEDVVCSSRLGKPSIFSLLGGSISKVFNEDDHKLIALRTPRLSPVKLHARG